MWLKQSTAVTITMGPFVDKDDAVTAYTTIIPASAVNVAKNGAASTGKSDTSAGIHDTDGHHRINLNVNDTGTLGRLRVHVSNAAAYLPIWQDFEVVPANVWDSYFGADRLEVDVQEWAGVEGAVKVGGTSGLPQVDTASVGNSAAISATSASNWNVFYENGGQTANAVIGEIGTLSYQGSVWISASTGTAGTTPNVNGLPENPVDTITDAVTIATAKNIRSLFIMDGAFTLTATLNDYVVQAVDWESSVNLGSQDVGGAVFRGLAVTGTQGGARPATFYDCLLDALTGADLQAFRCFITTSLATRSQGDMILIGCSSSENDVPFLDFTNGPQTVELNNLHGNIEIRNHGAADTTAIDIVGSLVIAATSAGTMRVTGAGTITNNGTTSIVDDAFIYAERVGDVHSWQGAALTGTNMVEDFATAPQFTTVALANAPSGSGTSPFNQQDAEEMRHRLGLTQTKADPGAVTASMWSVNVTTLIEDSTGLRYTAKALEQAPSGGGGLTEQQVRDAMKLAPTAGTPAAGSVDLHLDDIQAQTDQMGFTGGNINANAQVVSDKTGYSGTVTGGTVTTVTGNVNGSVGSVTSPVTVGTNNDKTGYSLAADQSTVTIGTVNNVADKTGYSGTVTGGSVDTVGTVTGNVNGSVNSVIQTVSINANDILGASLANAVPADNNDTPTLEQVLQGIWRIETETAYNAIDSTSASGTIRAPSGATSFTLGLTLDGTTGEVIDKTRNG